MLTSIGRLLFAAAAALLAASAAGAQGYVVRSSSYYDPVPFGPVVGGTYSVSPYRPMVALEDSWGRIVDMPLQPKVLYYNAPFLTADGWYRPTSIAVMPSSRPPSYTVPARPPEPVRPTGVPTFRYDGGPTVPVPDVIPEQPASKPVAPELPPLPKVPKAPDVDSGPVMPKLGPAPSGK
jgi:hypothetical protein